MSDAPREQPDPVTSLLAAYDVSCPYCAYDLRGISACADGLRCPECGLLLTRRVIRHAAEWRRLAVRRIVMIFGSLAVTLGCVLVDAWAPDGPTLLPAVLMLSLFLAAAAIVQELWALRKGRMTSPGIRFQSWFTILFASGGAIGALVMAHLYIV